MNAAAFEAALARDGFTEIERKTAQPNVLSSAHSHPCDIRALLTSGELTLHCQGADRVYRAGDMVDIKAGLEHTERNGPEGYSYIVGRRKPQN